MAPCLLLSTLILVLVTKKYDESLMQMIKGDKAGNLEKRLEIISSLAEGIREVGKEDEDGDYHCHLDIKPDNVYVGIENGEWDRQLVLADFGIGSFEYSAKKYGTCGFGSPEQFAMVARPSSDVFSLAKLAILVLFRWNVAWFILATPEKDEKIQFLKSQFESIPIFNQFLEFLREMLNVSFDKIHILISILGSRNVKKLFEVTFISSSPN